jgi:gluconolactonase
MPTILRITRPFLFTFHLLLFTVFAFPASAQNIGTNTSPTSHTRPLTPPPVNYGSLPLPPTVAANATVVKLAGNFAFTEGAACAPNGDPYFVDQPNNRIMHWSVADNKLLTFLQPSGYSNGEYFDAKGNLISCADENNQLWSIAPDGSHTILVTNYHGLRLNGPNDVWIRPDGGMYLTDPFYKRTWWDHTAQPQDREEVYFLAPDHVTLTRVTDDLVKPNGIIGAPDGKTLYVGDIKAGHTFAYDIQPDGSLLNKRLVCNYGSDGMTLDNQGNLGLIPMPEAPANLCFAGKNHSTLYICARTGFYTIPTNVQGANPAK